MITRKRCLSLLLSALITTLCSLFVFGGVAWATPVDVERDVVVEKASELLYPVYLVRDDLERYGLDNITFDEDLQIGSGIYVYETTGSLIEKNGICYYPVFQDDTVVAMITTLTNEYGTTVTISSRLIDEISPFLQTNEEAVIVRYDEATVLRSDEEAIFLESVLDSVVSLTNSQNSVRGNGATESIEFDSAEILADTFEYEFISQDLKTTIYTPERMQEFDELAATDDFSVISANDSSQDSLSLGKDSLSDEFSVLSTEETEDDETPKTGGFETLSISELDANVMLSEYPIVTQGFYGICWAAALSSMGQYMTGTAISPQSIAMSIKGSLTGGTDAEARQGLALFSYATGTSLNSTTRYPLASGDEIRVNIAHGLPVYAHCRPSVTTDSNHVVIVYGYALSGSSLYIMNPGTSGVGALEIATMTSGSSYYSFLYNNQTYTWNYSSTHLVGWQEVDENCYYFNLDGSGTKYVGWQLINGAWYYFDPGTGIMRMGWLQWNGNWYYLNPNNKSGAMFKGWHEIGGYWHYFEPQNDSGRLLINQWISPSRPGNSRTAWAYVDSDGQAVTGWKYLPDWSSYYYYYFDNNGSVVSGWLELDNSWFFLRTEASYPSYGPYASMVMAWQKIGSYWYYFEAGGSGKMQTSQWISPSRTGNNSSNWGYVGADGRALTGWQWLYDIDGYYWFYFNSSASVVMSQVVYDSGGPCWLKSNGRAAQSEYVTINGVTYYVNSSGHIQGY
jgi:glucan-binding YG repeat protein